MIPIPQDEMVEVAQHRLEWTKVQVQKALSRQEFNAIIDADVLYDHVADYVVMRFTAFVASEQIDHVTFSYPLTWWDAFKLRWAPQWALKRWPAQKKTTTIKVKALYPHWVDLKRPENLGEPFFIYEVVEK